MHPWFAPAKLNLFLHITGRRADGYHMLQTVFQFVKLADQLWFKIIETAEITRTPALEEVPEEQDLTIRAAKQLQQASQCRLGARIHIEKNIPVGGGLGGGSSNAATTLVALNQLWQLNLPQQELVEIGLELGADVPVFINGWAAWAEGIGEQCRRIDLPEPWYLIIYPACCVSTAHVFNKINLTHDISPIRIADFFNGKTKNDCEKIVRAEYPSVDNALNWLDQHTEARLTGTGACVFAEFADKQQALIVSQQLPDKWQGFIVQGKNRSSLFDPPTRYNAYCPENNVKTIV